MNNLDPMGLFDGSGLDKYLPQKTDYGRHWGYWDKYIHETIVTPDGENWGFTPIDGGPLLGEGDPAHFIREDINGRKPKLELPELPITIPKKCNVTNFNNCMAEEIDHAKKDKNLKWSLISNNCNGQINNLEAHCTEKACK